MGRVDVGSRTLRVDTPWVFVCLWLLGFPLPETWPALRPGLLSPRISAHPIQAPDHDQCREFIPAHVHSGRLESLLLRRLLRSPLPPELLPLVRLPTDRASLGPVLQLLAVPATTRRH